MTAAYLRRQSLADEVSDIGDADTRDANWKSTIFSKSPSKNMLSALISPCNSIGRSVSAANAFGATSPNRSAISRNRRWHRLR